MRSTIDLAHGLGLDVVAEGVEDAAVLALLQDLGCDLVQGFHLGRPAPPDAFLELLGDPGVSLRVADPGLTSPRGRRPGSSAVSAP